MRRIATTESCGSDRDNFSIRKRSVIASCWNFSFQIHDPTTLNRQGNDRGMSYRSAIFNTSEAQKEVALDTMRM